VTELRVHLPDDVAARLAAQAAQRGTSTEDLAADMLTRNASITAADERRFAFVGMFDAPPGAPSVAEAERMLEDGLDDGFGR
jgi:hypothetical protein